jgi:ferritin-like metal-binding protein YciE
LIRSVSAIPGKAPAVKLPPTVESGEQLLLEELGRLLTIEETLAKLMLPELLQELQDDGLRLAVQEHLAETRGHAGRVKEAFLALGVMPAGKPAYGLDGLRTEHKATAPHVVPGARGAVHCAAAMGTEHYEINAYEAAIRLAEALDAKDVARLLRANLEQEIEALQKLGNEADRLARLAVEARTVNV